MKEKLKFRVLIVKSLKTALQPKFIVQMTRPTIYLYQITLEISLNRKLILLVTLSLCWTNPQFFSLTVNFSNGKCSLCAFYFYLLIADNQEVYFNLPQWKHWNMGRKIQELRFYGSLSGKT